MSHRVRCHNGADSPFFGSAARILLAGALLWLAASAGLAPRAEGAPSDRLTEAREMLRRGNLEGAVPALEEATRTFSQSDDPAREVEALVLLSRAQQAVGQQTRAQGSADRALERARKTHNAAGEAAALAQLGNLFLGTRQPEEAGRRLDAALAMARKLGDSRLEASILNDQGNRKAAVGLPQDALTAYSESAAKAAVAGAADTRATALANSASLLVRTGDAPAALAALEQASGAARALEDSRAKAFALISVGLGYRDLRAREPGQPELAEKATGALREAGEVGERIGDLREASYGWGYLGSVREAYGDRGRALADTRRAVLLAQRANAPESLYRWQWQTGRILRSDGEPEAATEAYRLATGTLQSIREETSNCYGRPKASFREYAEPVYLEFVDLLLQRSAVAPTPEASRPYLREARNAVELLKVFQLQDYFNDDCIGAGRRRSVPLEEIGVDTAVIYTVFLPDRLELLVSLPGGIRRFPVSEPPESVNREARVLRRLLEKRTTRQYLPHAQRLYDWLLRPLESHLTSAGVRTLVFVPDADLQMVPLGALHDGSGFLVERYAIARTPGLRLTDPRPMHIQGMKLLALGLAEGVQGFPPLPQVAGEMASIREVYPTKLLMNRDFTASGMEGALGDETYGIVHIASHAQFDTEVSNSFLLAYDQEVTLDRLERSVGLLRVREEPVELLTLSACDTAVGDDRASLGLAGVAVKAGARSALATLWSINDRASSQLVAEFYRALHVSGTSRAEALRQAQLKILKDPVYAHPAYWSPFILIANWL